MRTSVLVGLLTAGIAYADKAPETPAPPRELLGAIQTGDAKVAATFVGKWPLWSMNVWFDNAECATKFGGKSQVLEADFPAYVTCLQGLGLRDGSGLDYQSEPGIFVGPRFDGGGKLRYLVGALPIDGSSPTVPVTVVHKNLKKAGTFVVSPAAADKTTLDASHGTVSVSVRFCVSTKGRTESVTFEDHADKDASYAKTVHAAIKTWTFKPFLRKGKAIRVCTRVYTSYPADSLDLVLTPPPPPPPPPPMPPPPPEPGEGTAVAPTLLEPNRIKGDKNILPDEATKKAMAQAKKDKAIGSFKLCIDATGKVTTVGVIKASGFPPWDSKIGAEMQKWEYKPYILDGKAAPVCTAVTFIYTQKQPAKK